VRKQEPKKRKPSRINQFIKVITSHYYLTATKKAKSHPSPQTAAPKPLQMQKTSQAQNGQPSSTHHILSSEEWISRLSNREGAKENQVHFWGKDPKILSTISSAEDFTTGSGLEIYTSTLLPALETAEQEIILVTCFWAPSQTLTSLSSTLINLSDRFLDRPPGAPKLRVRLCLSSRSILQKLFHTSSVAGYIYPPSQWVSKLGLPPPEKLRGLDLQVKSIFILPFSVMHPKFIIIDRHRAFLPSCNVSHETWLECCISFRGPIIQPLLEFWRSFWGRNDFPVLQISTSNRSTNPPPSPRLFPTILLPSPHHRFALPRPFPFIPSPPPPPTPLNVLLLHLLDTATHSITCLTPNLTSPPLLPAMLSALKRNINITIITNRRMMLPEQLLTAGTITELFIWRLIRKYRQTQTQAAAATRLHRSARHAMRDEEAETGMPRSKIGQLRIGYFVSERQGFQKTHVKCTIVDDEIVVLGSGNMDRASWFTSQELGVALAGREMVREVWGGLEGRLEGGRMEKYFGW
jgi:phosphatidylserine/phosphatidylglycerophosphate/cardiolipin synthase-like enzyme